MTSPNPYGVKVGQVWADNDPRVEREITITAVVLDGAYPHAFAACGPRTSRIRLDRFKETASGYVLVRDVDGDTP